MMMVVVGDFDDEEAGGLGLCVYRPSLRKFWVHDWWKAGRAADSQKESVAGLDGKLRGNLLRS